MCKHFLNKMKKWLLGIQNYILKKIKNVLTFNVSL